MKEWVRTMLVFALIIALLPGMIALGENDYDAVALVERGMAYFNGDGVDQDYVMAAELLRQAAEMGNVDAQNNLGWMYQNGYGVDQDYDEAFVWFSKAAEQNFSIAQVNLGKCFVMGWGTGEDYEKAAEWFAKAAEQGNAVGQCNLAVFYNFGTGVEQDFEKAYMLFSSAAEQNYPDAQYWVGLYWQDGLCVQQDYAEAARWFLRAAEQNHPEAQFNLGIYYDYGYGVEQDHIQAAEWYAKAAEQGFTQAQYNLGLLFFNGNGVEQDYATAFILFSQAAEQHEAGAMFYLGQCYRLGLGTDVDCKKALEWYEQAVDSGFVKAYYGLGILYEYGLGTEQDYEKAAEMFLQAADSGVPEANEEYDYCIKMLNTIQSQALITWNKGHFRGGRMYIKTEEIIQGTMTDPSGRTTNAGMRLFQDWDSFFVNLFDASGQLIENPDSSGIPVHARIVWYEGDPDKEYPFDCDTEIAGSGDVIRLRFSMPGMLQSVLKGTSPSPNLILSFPDGKEYRFIVPDQTNYGEMLDAFANSRYIPTYNDDLFTGDGVNPDLAAFLKEFSNVFLAVLQNRYNSGVDQAQAFGLAILDKRSTGNSQLDDLLDWYWILDQPQALPRKVDSDAFQRVKSSVDTVVTMLTVSYALDQADQLNRELLEIRDIINWLDQF